LRITVFRVARALRFSSRPIASRPRRPVPTEPELEGTRRNSTAGCAARRGRRAAVSQPVELGFLGGANDMASVDVRLRAEHYEPTSVFRTGAGYAEWFAPFGQCDRSRLAKLPCACRCGGPKPVQSIKSPWRLADPLAARYNQPTVNLKLISLRGDGQGGDLGEPRCGSGRLGSPSAATTIDGKQLPAPAPKFGGVAPGHHRFRHHIRRFACSRVRNF
jgi:hypothetical protein